MKIWKPDTCNCIIEEIYNGNEILGGGAIVKKCESHKNVPDNELYGVLYSNPDGENKRKNTLYKHFLENNKGVISEDIEQDDGSVITKFKKGINFNWSFSGLDKDRVLEVEITGAEIQKSVKDSARSVSEGVFGVGKVIIK